MKWMSIMGKPQSSEVSVSSNVKSSLVHWKSRNIHSQHPGCTRIKRQALPAIKDSAVLTCFWYSSWKSTASGTVPPFKVMTTTGHRHSTDTLCCIELSDEAMMSSIANAKAAINSSTRASGIPFVETKGGYVKPSYVSSVIRDSSRQNLYLDALQMAKED